MQTVLQVISLQEWESASPESHPVLAGLSLDGLKSSSDLVEFRTPAKKLMVRELKSGLELNTTSFVGRVQLGSLMITISPKIRGVQLLQLLRYAFGFRELEIFAETKHDLEQMGFDELLICQLNAEVEELISRGLQRAYEPLDERLASPRGKIDVRRIAEDGGLVTAALPCRYFPRLEDTFLNRVILGGLKLAAELADFIELRRESRRLASRMEELVSPLRLDAVVMKRAEQRLTRQTISYQQAIGIIRLLVEARGIELEGTGCGMPLPGFLFDMNLFFERLMSRFIRENLNGVAIKEQHQLKQMMRYSPKFNPQGKTAINPRPDLAVMQKGRLLTLLDAKYRDLWALQLPNSMLYQLIVYAMSQRSGVQSLPQSSILYPTTDPAAREARIDVTDPIGAQPIAQVCLRPVNLSKLATMIAGKTIASRLERAAEARRLAFGTES
jgi:5-methylcytosine-specific restriction enzyme subunit McrC